MTHPENKSSYSLNNSLGTALLLLGGILAYLRVEAIGRQLAGMLTPYGSDLVGLFSMIGLAAARLLQAFTLSPTSAASAILLFLLSFWPVAAILSGVILLRKNLFPPAMPPCTASRPSGSLLRGMRR
jgi:hypothetical protein